MAGGAAMELEKKTLESIGQYVRKNLAAWIAEAGLTPWLATTPAGIGEAIVPAAAFPSSPETGPSRGIPDSILLERLIRLEEELKSQREIMNVRFESMDKRFDDLIHHLDKRFSSVQWVMGLGFTLMAGLMAVFNFF